MGCLKRLKPAIKEIRRELTGTLMFHAGQVVTTLQRSIDDGKITKSEAGQLGADALKLVFGVTTAAANAAIMIAVRAVLGSDAVSPEDLYDEDVEDEVDLG